mmetsp:Transcript_81/g.283  ORF Transcript_81/g.283 Transcript_81/m.283 type:complete len:143 (-) Transcript_81:552-980(-)
MMCVVLAVCWCLRCGENELVLWVMWEDEREEAVRMLITAAPGVGFVLNYFSGVVVVVVSESLAVVLICYEKTYVWSLKKAHTGHRRREAGRKNAMMMQSVKFDLRIELADINRHFISYIYCSGGGGEGEFPRPKDGRRDVGS